MVDIPPLAFNIRNNRTGLLLHCPENNNVCAWSTEDINNKSNQWYFEKTETLGRYVIRNVRTWLELHCAENLEVCVYQHIEGSND